MKHAPKATIVRTRLLLSVLFVSGISSLGAQTLFFVPDTAADLSRYKTVEECAIAVMRTERSERWRRSIWPDTTELAKSVLLDSISPQAQAVAQRCVAKFRPDSVSVKEYLEWMQLYMQANRDGAADTVLQHRLRTADPQDSMQRRAIILKQGLNIYTEARPVRWTKVLALEEQIEQQKAMLPFMDLLQLYGGIANMADRLNDTVVALRNAEKAVAFAATLTPEQKTDRPYRVFGSETVRQMFDFLARRDLQDSLRRGAAAYLALKQANWVKARGDNNDNLPGYVGESAKTIVADFWFAPLPPDSSGRAVHPPLTSTPIRPTPGKVALVVFLRGSCHDDALPTIPPERVSYKVSCWSTYAVLRRFAQRFPGLEITMVSQTAGNLAGMPPLTPKEEAQVLQGLWQGFHRLPGTLAVATTQFFKTPGLERRRIDDLTQNSINYTFEDNREIHSTAAYLVDTNGQILCAGNLDRESERTFRGLLDVVMSRVKGDR